MRTRRNTDKSHVERFGVERLVIFFMTKKKQFIEDMKRCRGIDFAQLGMMVEISGDVGTIKGMNSSGNLNIVFANTLKHGTGKQNCHPTWDIKYFDKDGAVLGEYGRD